MIICVSKSCCAKYGHLDQIRWFTVLNVLLELICMCDEFYLMQCIMKSPICAHKGWLNELCIK